MNCARNVLFDKAQCIARILSVVNTFRALTEELRKRAAQYHGELIHLADEAKVSRRWLSLFVNDKKYNATVDSLDQLNNAILKREKATRQ